MDTEAAALAIDPRLAAVALYAGLAALIAIWLALHVGRVRGQVKVLIGDGGNPRLIRAMRGQANFVENVPLALILLLTMALLGTPAWVIHLFGIALTLGRVLHALHFTADAAPQWQRGAGAGLTLLVLLLGGLGMIGHAVAALL
jgi:hypothetical protein